MTKIKSQPKNWQRVKLESLFKIKHGYAFKGKFFADTGNYIVLTPGNFTEKDGLVLRKEKEKYYTGDFPGEYILDKDDLLVVMTDLKQTAPYLGAPGIIPQNDKYLHNQRLGLVQSINSNLTDKSFLYWLFEGEEYRTQVRGSATGATVKHTSPTKIYEVEVSIPNLSSQKQIADILSAYDELIENNTRRIKILEEIAQAIYKEWFVYFRFPGYKKIKMVDPVRNSISNGAGSKTEFGKIPEGWEVKEVGDIIRRVQSGKKYNNKTVSKKGKVPVLDQGKSGMIGYHNDEPGVIASEDNPIIVFANHTCYQNLIMFPFSAIQNILPFYPSDDYPRSIYWLHWATKDLIELSDYKGHWPEFIKKAVVVPTQKISENFEQKITSIIIEKLKLENINQKLRQARDLLLPKLISGEIEVKY